ncbi:MULTISPECIES: tRNA lysidine(34) synthetase TilS [Luteimonas]|uniref:tRNA lysidine(34) synthetase TilS n=1 Tax=Luteimonas TaxID=83614 RepID=UPI000C7CF509|nr:MULTISPECIES: tRNA lysidine(34) synthetase TilS [Luteimonas]
MTSAFPDLPLPVAPEGGAVLVGFSGGLDSTALLHRLARDPDLRARGLRAVHVHHGLQAGADAWAAQCRGFCAALDVPLAVVRVVVDRASGLGLEGAARAARHAAFAGALGDGELLALAHHRDDQAETFLLRALRASGPDGLAAMRAQRPLARGQLWRPLLDTPRAALLAYARSHALTWVEDPSNARDDADRNFLRHQVLPLLRTRWPHAAAALATAAELQAGTVGLLDSGDADALAQVRSLDPQVLRVEALRGLPAARRARVLRRWVAGLGLAPLPAAGVAWCDATGLAASSDRTPCFEWHGCRLQRWRDLLHADRAHPPLPAAFEVRWTGETPLPLPGGGVLRLAPAAAWPWPVTVRARRGGERIVQPGRPHSHALQHVLQSLGVPPWVRAGLPLLVDDEDRLLAAGDLAFAAEADAWLRTHGAVMRWQRPGLQVSRPSTSMP